VSAGAEVDERPPPLLLEWGVAVRPLRGETQSGDAAVVRFCGETALVAACDGLGHGPDAARAAAAAAAVLEQFEGEDVVSLAHRCDEALRTTRGAAISLAVFSASPAAVTWVGIGNVEGRVVRGSLSGPGQSQSLTLHPGIAGEGLPPLHAVTLPVARGDTLLFATDGVHDRFADWLVPVGPPQEIAERIVDEHSKSTDDALVLVARYLGARP
jgi:serine/threonine protein phosphatase PrpC